MYSTHFLNCAIENIHHLDGLTRKSVKNQRKMRRLFCDFIQDFSQTKQLSGLHVQHAMTYLYVLLKPNLLLTFRFVGTFNEIVEFSITVLFLHTLICIGCLFFSVQLLLVELFTLLSLTIIFIFYHSLVIFAVGSQYKFNRIDTSNCSFTFVNRRSSLRR